MRHGQADGLHLLDLLARDASAVEFERPVVEARAAGLPAADIEALDRAKRVALGVREQLAAHRRREAELAALFQTASDLAALTSVDEVLAAIVRRARALLGRDTAYLCLNDEERGDTYMRVTDGSVSAEFQAVRLPLGAGLGGLVAQQGVPIASAGYFRDERFSHTIDHRLGGPGRGSGLDHGRAAQARLAGDRRAVRRRPSPERASPGTRSRCCPRWPRMPRWRWTTPGCWPRPVPR